MTPRTLSVQSTVDCLWRRRRVSGVRTFMWAPVTASCVPPKVRGTDPVPL